MHKVVIIAYTNWRGERSKRRIVPIHEGIWYGFNDWHREPQWLLDANDLDKGETRTFALKDIHSWEPEPDPRVSDEHAKREDPKGLSGEAMPARSCEAGDAHE